MVYLPFLSGIQRIYKSFKRFSKFIVCYNKPLEYAQLGDVGAISMTDLRDWLKAYNIKNSMGGEMAYSTIQRMLSSRWLFILLGLEHSR